MRICCVLAYSMSRNRVFYEKDSISQSTLYEIESALVSRGHDVIVLDYLSEEDANPTNINEVLEGFLPDVICIYALHQSEDCLWFFKHIDISLLSCIFIAAGSGVIDVNRTFSIVPELSYIIPCYSEWLLPNLIECLSGKKKKSIPKGVGYKEGSEIVFTNSERLSGNEVFPKVDLDKLISHKDNRLCFMRTSKGCWYGRCTYCTVAACYKGINRWIYRCMNDVIDEAMALYAKGVRQYTFLDDEFIGPGSIGKERTLIFANEFKKACPDAHFSIRTRIDTVDKEIISALKEAGLNALFLGIESLSDSFLKATQKGYAAQLIYDKWEVLKNSGVVIVPGIIMAYQNSTLDDLLEHFSGVELLYIHSQYTMPLSPIFHQMHLHAGTQEYNNAIKFANHDTHKSEMECTYSDLKVKQCINSIVWLGELVLPFLSEVMRFESSKKIVYSYLVKKKTFIMIKSLIKSYIKFGIDADSQWRAKVYITMEEFGKMISCQE